jgi:hypothetical protein
MIRYSLSIGGRTQGRSVAKKLHAMGEEFAGKAIEIQRHTPLNITRAIYLVEMGLTYEDFQNSEYRLSFAYSVLENDYTSFIIFCRSVVILKYKLTLLDLPYVECD